MYAMSRRRRPQARRTVREPTVDTPDRTNGAAAVRSAARGRRMVRTAERTAPSGEAPLSSLSIGMVYFTEGLAIGTLGGRA